MDEYDGERNVNVDVDGAEVGDGHDDDYDADHGADHDDYDAYDDDGALGCPQRPATEVHRMNCRRHDLHSLWARTAATHERKERKKIKKEQERKDEGEQGGGWRKMTGKGT